MNKHIEEMANKVGIKIIPLVIDGIEYSYRNVEVTNDKILQEFAELIVKECVAVVDGMTDPEDSERYFWAIQNVSQKIKEHFGVEE